MLVQIKLQYQYQTFPDSSFSLKASSGEHRGDPFCVKDLIEGRKQEGTLKIHKEILKHLRGASMRVVNGLTSFL